MSQIVPDSLSFSGSLLFPRKQKKAVSSDDPASLYNSRV
jgi:hypothetical protein